MPGLKAIGATQRNVVYLGSTAGPPRTGGERYDLEVLKFLQANGWTTHILVPPSRLDIALAKRHIRENFWFLRQALPITDKKTVVVENLYLHSRALLLNLYLRTKRNIPVIGILHHLSYHDLRSPVYRMIDHSLVRLSLSLMDHIVTVSESSRASLRSLGVRADKICVIPDATDAPHKDRSSRLDGRVHALFVGTCCPRKGLDYLVRAMALMQDYPIVLHIVGDLEIDHNYAKEVIGLTRALCLEDRIVFHGWVSQEALWQQYGQADIFVLPSLWEGYGIVLLEAMAFGLPIVATRVGAVPELIEDGQNGLLVPPGNVETLAMALRRICTDASLRHKLESESKARRTQLRSWEVVGQEFAGLLEGLAS